MRKDSSYHLLDINQVCEMLGVYEKTIRTYVKEQDFPMTRVGNRLVGHEWDILNWLRSRYSDGYRKMAENPVGERLTESSGKSNFSAELIGISEDDQGKKRIVKGERFVDLFRNGSVGGEKLVSIRLEGQGSTQTRSVERLPL